MCDDVKVARAYLQKFDNAKSAGVEWDLSFTAYKNMYKAKRCYYTGLQLTNPRRNERIRSTDRTIDRIDNNLGYVAGNCVAASELANGLKARLENPTDPMSTKLLKKFTSVMEAVEK